MLGENGAGKTTLLHLIAGLLYPTEGECLVNGNSMTRRRPSELSSVFFLGDSMPFPAKTINEMARIHGVFYPRFNPKMLKENLASFGFTGKERLDRMSLGNRHKSQIAYALALNVDTLLLDEPANGLDINSKQSLQSMIAHCVGEEQTVIISTHTVADLQNLFDGIIVLSRGHLLLAASTGNITEKVAFVTSPIPEVSPVYQETRINMFHSITANDGSSDSDIDYLLLYNALMKPESRSQLLQLLNNDNNGHNN